MLRVKREQDELIFDLIPPFNLQFFEELETSIIDFQSLGKTKFAFNFKLVEQLNNQEVHFFDSILPVYQKKGLKFRFLHVSKNVEQRLSGLIDYLSKKTISNRKSPNFCLDCQLFGQIAILRPIGDFLVQESLDEFKSRSQHYLAIADALIFDCHDLRFISTLSVGGFVFLKMQTNKPILLCNVSGTIFNALKMAGLTKIIPLFNSEEECHQYLQQKIEQIPLK